MIIRADIVSSCFKISYVIGDGWIDAQIVTLKEA